MLTIRVRRSDGTLALDVPFDEGVALLADAEALVWFDIEEDSSDSAAEIARVGAALSLNHLTVEDLTHK